MSTDVPATPVAPAAPDAPSVEGTTAGPGRPKANKVDYRQEGSDLLADWPTDFDPRVHKPLKVEDFSAEDKYWAKRADMYDSKAKHCRTQAELFLKFGNADKRKAAEKLTKMAEKMAQLKKELEADGIDVSTLGIDMSTLA